MERGEDPWKPKFDRRTGEATRRVDDYWWCSAKAPDHERYRHDSIRLGRRTVPVPDARPCA